MKVTGSQFRDAPEKAITLLGMSGIGKTHLASLLPRDKWFHYSGDYRIGTRYLNESILDAVKVEAMKNTVLRELLCSDSIYIRNNITFTHLKPISSYLGKIGDSSKGGLDLETFKERQRLFRWAEVQAMRDVACFIGKARGIYGYPNFLNDAGGSICGLGHEECWESLSQHTIVLYLKADQVMEDTLIKRARACPKPLFYEEPFLNESLEEYIQSNNLNEVGDIDPDEFVQWVFPRLIAHRRGQYEAIAERYGYIVDASRLGELENESDFFDLICESMS